jgi:hypothetical protein
MKIAFASMWPDFDRHNNLWLHALREVTSNVEVVDSWQQADMLFFSGFGGGPPVDVDREGTVLVGIPMTVCDYSITHSIEPHGGRNFRLPFWMWCIDWFGKGRPERDRHEAVISLSEITDNDYLRRPRSGFCSVVATHGGPGNMRAVLPELFRSEGSSVTARGALFKAPIPIDQKYGLLADHRWNICLENAAAPGYHTEKLFDAKVTGAIPIYWSSPTYGVDFNPSCCLHLKDFENAEHLVQEVLRIDADPRAYRALVEEPMFYRPPAIDGFLHFLYTKIVKGSTPRHQS